MPLSDAQVTKLYSQRKSCAEIAQLGCCSETSIYNQLKSLSVPMRSRSEANQIFPDSVFIILYNIGLSVSQTGRLLGVDPSTVTKRLHTLGFPLRSRNTACRIRYTEEEFQSHFMISSVLDVLMNLIEEE